MRYYILQIAILFIASFAFAEPQLTKPKVVELAQKAIKDFCAPNGCSYKTTKDESGWHVLASFIRSSDNKGQPVYAPEENALVNISFDRMVKVRYGNEPSEHTIPPVQLQ